MYNEQLEKLIEMALVDGELTEKEKQILFKKAEAFGVDLDEFEMVLQSKLFEKKKSDSSVSAAPKSDKLGDVRKCPACGAIAESFAVKCQDCGTEFRNIEASQNIIKFFEKLDEIESNRKDSVYGSNKSSEGIGILSLLKWFLFWYILLPIKIVTFFINKSKPAKWSTTDSRKEELILNFPVPASKEEILEFLTLAYSRINENTFFNLFSEETKYKNAWNKIWLKKIEQINAKASLAMKNDKKSFEDVQKIANESRNIIKSNNSKAVYVSIGFALIIVVLIAWAKISNNNIEANHSKEKDLKTKAEEYIKAGDYQKAESIINTLSDKIFIIELKSKIQLDELSKKTQELESYLQDKDYDKLKLELEKITWTKISSDFEAASTERDYFKNFLKLKRALNNQMPKKYQIEIESEYSL